MHQPGSGKKTQKRTKWTQKNGQNAQKCAKKRQKKGKKKDAKKAVNLKKSCEIWEEFSSLKKLNQKNGKITKKNKEQAKN